MEFTTKVNITKSTWTIHPCERMLFVGSCFANNMGKRFHDEKFNTDINPYGVMYNPASILHTVEKGQTLYALSQKYPARLSLP